MAKEFTDDLRKHYKLNIVSISAEEHDRQMAKRQAIAFSLSHCLISLGYTHKIDLLTIPSELKLQELIRIEKDHSDDLYKTIMCTNPYARGEVEKLKASISSQIDLLWSNSKDGSSN